MKTDKCVANSQLRGRIQNNSQTSVEEINVNKNLRILGKNVLLRRCLTMRKYVPVAFTLPTNSIILKWIPTTKMTDRRKNVEMWNCGQVVKVLARGWSPLLVIVRKHPMRQFQKYLFLGVWSPGKSYLFLNKIEKALLENLICSYGSSFF